MQRSNHRTISQTAKAPVGPEIIVRTNRKLPPSVIDGQGGLASWVTGFFFWFVQRPHLQNGLIAQILAHSHKKGCPLHLFDVSDTT